MGLLSRARHLARRVVQRGKRSVVLTQETAGLGNFLYEWRYAWSERQSGRDVVCLATPKMEPWLRVFGAAAVPLVVRRDQMRLTDRRIREVHNEFGVHFGAQDLEVFAAGFLEPSGVIDLAQVPVEQRMTDSDVLINVRRGDYFSVDAHRRSYAFDVDEYLSAALDIARAHGPIDRILWSPTGRTGVGRSSDGSPTTVGG